MDFSNCDGSAADSLLVGLNIKTAETVLHEPLNGDADRLRKQFNVAQSNQFLPNDLEDHGVSAVHGEEFCSPTFKPAGSMNLQDYVEHCDESSFEQLSGTVTPDAETADEITITDALSCASSNSLVYAAVSQEILRELEGYDSDVEITIDHDSEQAGNDWSRASSPFLPDRDTVTPVPLEQNAVESEGPISIIDEENKTCSTDPSEIVPREDISVMEAGDSAPSEDLPPTETTFKPLLEESSKTENVPATGVHTEHQPDAPTDPSDFTRSAGTIVADQSDHVNDEQQRTAVFFVPSDSDSECESDKRRRSEEPRYRVLDCEDFSGHTDLIQEKLLDMPISPSLSQTEYLSFHEIRKKFESFDEPPVRNNGLQPIPKYPQQESPLSHAPAEKEREEEEALSVHNELHSMEVAELEDPNWMTLTAHTSDIVSADNCESSLLSDKGSESNKDMEDAPSNTDNQQGDVFYTEKPIEEQEKDEVSSFMLSETKSSHLLKSYVARRSPSNQEVFHDSPTDVAIGCSSLATESEFSRAMDVEEFDDGLSGPYSTSMCFITQSCGYALWDSTISVVTEDALHGTSWDLSDDVAENEIVTYEDGDHVDTRTETPETKVVEYDYGGSSVPSGAELNFCMEVIESNNQLNNENPETIVAETEPEEQAEVYYSTATATNFDEVETIVNDATPSANAEEFQEFLTAPTSDITEDTNILVAIPQKDITETIIADTTLHVTTPELKENRFDNTSQFTEEPGIPKASLPADLGSPVENTVVEVTVDIQKSSAPELESASGCVAVAGLSVRSDNSGLAGMQGLEADNHSITVPLNLSDELPIEPTKIDWRQVTENAMSSLAERTNKSEAPTPCESGLEFPELRTEHLSYAPFCPNSSVEPGSATVLPKEPFESEVVPTSLHVETKMERSEPVSSYVDVDDEGATTDVTDETEDTDYQFHPSDFSESIYRSVKKRNAVDCKSGGKHGDPVLESEKSLRSTAGSYSMYMSPVSHTHTAQTRRNISVSLTSLNQSDGGVEVHTVVSSGVRLVDIEPIEPLALAAPDSPASVQPQIEDPDEIQPAVQSTEVMALPFDPSLAGLYDRVIATRQDSDGAAAVFLYPHMIPDEKLQPHDYIMYNVLRYVVSLLEGYMAEREVLLTVFTSVTRAKGQKCIDWLVDLLTVLSTKPVERLRKIAVVHAPSDLKAKFFLSGSSKIRKEVMSKVVFVDTLRALGRLQELRHSDVPVDIKDRDRRIEFKFAQRSCQC